MLLLRLALRPWERAPWSQGFSALAVGILLLLSGLLLWMQKGLAPLVARLQQEQVITAYLEPTVEAKEAPQIEGAIRDSLKVTVGASAIRDIRYVDPAQFLDSIRKPYPELARELEDLGEEMNSVIPRHISVTGFLNEKALSEIRAVKGIETAESSRDRFQGLIGAFSALRWVSKMLTAGLVFALMIGLVHLARTNAHLHRDAIEFLKLSGTRMWVFKLPGVLSGLSVGLVGGLIAAAGWMTAGTWLTRHVRALSPLLQDLPVLPGSVALTFIATGTLLGAISVILAEIFAPIRNTSRMR